MNSRNDMQNMEQKEKTKKTLVENVEALTTPGCDIERVKTQLERLNSCLDYEFSKEELEDEIFPLIQKTLTRKVVDANLKRIGLPAIVSLSDICTKEIQLSPELIDGILRQGHKMLIAGHSKAAKSFALIQLAIALAEGRRWLNFQCKKSKVLYINLEIDGNSFDKRVQTCINAMHLPPHEIPNLYKWNLRGYAVDLAEIEEHLVALIRNIGIEAVIFDPIYKIMDGDENSAKDMKLFLSHFDRIMEQTGASVIYSHHHSKGSQSQKASRDRASGSGVFSRDADCVLDLLEVEVTPAKLQIYREQYNSDAYDDLTGWIVEGTIREFRAFKPFTMFFDYPLHIVDTEGILNDSRTSDQARAGMRGTNTTSGKALEKVRRLKEYLDMEIGNPDFDDNRKSRLPLQDAADYMGVTTNSIKNYLNKYEEISTEYKIQEPDRTGSRGAKSYIVSRCIEF